MTNLRDARGGFTLTEAVIATAITAIMSAAFAGFLAGVIKITTKNVNQMQSQEQARRALMRIEEKLIHANEIQAASATFVQFIVDIDQSPAYDPNGDSNGNGIPNYLDPDRDGDAALLVGATAQWQVGFNLKDDDEDGDGKIDVRQRLYLSTGALWFDMSVNEAPWGGRYLQRLAVHVSTFTLTYFGNKANPLGKNIDLNSDGVVTAAEIDAAVPPAGSGNNNGALDLAAERAYLTTMRIDLGIDWNADGKSDHRIQTDVYPPLLPIKSQSF